MVDVVDVDVGPRGAVMDMEVVVVVVVVVVNGDMHELRCGEMVAVSVVVCVGIVVDIVAAHVVVFEFIDIVSRGLVDVVGLGG